MALVPRRFRGSKAGQGRSLLTVTPSLRGAFGDGSTPTGPGVPVTLPTWPVSYTGNTYYVSASSTAASLSTSRSSPGNAQFALDNAASTSIIRFLGAGPYAAQLSINRAATTHLKLISDVPVFTDLVNLRPTSLTPADLAGLADTVVVGADLANSALLRDLLIRNGGYIWVEGLRAEFPSNWTVSNTLGGSTSGGTVSGIWFEKVRMWQGDGKNIQIGPYDGSNTQNKLNVVHKFWSASENQLGDPKEGGGTWTSSSGSDTPGSAICDYGVTSHQNSGSVQILECFFQMKANHFIAHKRGVGQNTPTVKNRVEGCLFSSWDRTFTLKNTALELGQECDRAGNDYTCWDIDILNNTFADYNMLVLYIKDQKNVAFQGNRIIFHNQTIFMSLDTGVSTNDGTTVGPLDPGPFDVSGNIIMDGSVNCDLYSVGVSTTITFANNSVTSLIPITTHDSFRAPGNMAQTNPPRITVVRTGGNASGFAAPVAA